MIAEAGRRTILLATIICQGRFFGTVDFRGVPGLRVVNRCAKDVKRAETWCAGRVLSKVNDCVEVAQCGWRRNGIQRNLIFAMRCGASRVEAICGIEP